MSGCRLSLHWSAVAAKKITLQVQSRDRIGSRDVKRLRRTGAIPGVVYGGGSDPRPIVVESAVLRAALTGDQGRNAILHVSVDGGPAVPSILKDWQVDPVRDRLRHIDLLQIALDKAITTHVSVVLTGESPGAKSGGTLNQYVHQLRVEALPTDVPNHLELDISSLDLGDSLHVSDIAVPAKVTVLDDPEELVVTVVHSRRTVGVEGEELTELGEGAPAEGEAEAADAADAAAE